MENILKQITTKKKERLIEVKKQYTINNILENIKSINNYIDFKKKLIKRNSEKKISIIAEIKKASPSAGLLVKNFDHLKIADIYVKNGVPFLSVLTEESFFLGKLDYIKNIKKKKKLELIKVILKKMSFSKI